MPREIPSGRVQAAARRMEPVEPTDLPHVPWAHRAHFRSTYRAKKGDLTPVLFEVHHLYPDLTIGHQLWLLASVITTVDDRIAVEARNVGKNLYCRKDTGRPSRGPRSGR